MLEQHYREQLLEVARASIRHGLQHGTPLSVDVEDYDEALRVERATFVTLKRSGELRGCIGTLEAHRPLVSDVADNAFSAAFRDPRFPPLGEGELDDMHLDISILTPPEPLQFASEAELLAQLQPGEDGLIMEEGLRRGTFLPAVWEQLPTPEQFLQHLKLKAGLPGDYWSDTLKVSRYRSEAFGAEFIV